ncbi:MAG: HU family DNA-binding protein [Bacteroidaceae bacterium]|nr:HU family DNA-binding protein [Bacteroidaceae bacterium]
MIDFEIKTRTITIGDRKGQTVYYAYPKMQQKMTNKMVIDRIVRETSLSAGDVRNALTSLSSVVNDALAMGMSVDLADLGSLRLTVPSKMMDSAEEVTVEKALKTPKIVFTPKAAMKQAANSVELSIDRPKANSESGDTSDSGSTDTGDGGSGTGGNPL